MVPASLSAEADWAALADAHFGVLRILKRAGAEMAWPSVDAFLQTGGQQGHWGSFIRNFPQFVRMHQDGFNEAPGFRQLLRVVLLHDIAARCHQLLYGRSQLCYDIDYVTNSADAPPPYHPSKGRAVRLFPLRDFVLAADAVARKYTACSASILDHWTHLLPAIMEALVRPDRQLQIVLVATPFSQVLHIREAAVANNYLEAGFEGEVLATLTCAAMGRDRHSLPTMSVLQQIIAEATLDLYVAEEEDQAMGLALPLLKPPVQA
jgi:hypothetical protein